MAPSRLKRHLEESFLQETSLHGFKYFADPGSSRLQYSQYDLYNLYVNLAPLRVVWSLVITASVLGTCFYLLSTMDEYVNAPLRYRDCIENLIFYTFPFRVSVNSTSTPLSALDFPAVTVCSGAGASKVKVIAGEENNQTAPRTYASLKKLAPSCDMLICVCLIGGQDCKEDITDTLTDYGWCCKVNSGNYQKSKNYLIAFIRSIRLKKNVLVDWPRGCSWPWTP